MKPEINLIYNNPPRGVDLSQETEGTTGEAIFAKTNKETSYINFKTTTRHESI